MNNDNSELGDLKRDLSRNNTRNKKKTTKKATVVFNEPLTEEAEITEMDDRNVKPTLKLSAFTLNHLDSQGNSATNDPVSKKSSLKPTKRSDDEIETEPDMEMGRMKKKTSNNTIQEEDDEGKQSETGKTSKTNKYMELLRSLKEKSEQQERESNDFDNEQQSVITRIVKPTMETQNIQISGEVIYTNI
jgi:hypothetical protein